MQGNGYVIGFAIAVCVVCSLLLSGVSGALKERQEENRTLDRQKNILMALDLKSQDDLGKMERKAISDLYKTGVKEIVLDKKGNVVDDKKIADLPKKTRTGEDKVSDFLSLYKRVDDPSKEAYAYPVTGKGLWSTLYGYLAVKPNGSEIVGLTFYKHGETPGLGAEIEQPWFRNNFKKQKLYKAGKLVGVEVVKGKERDLTRFKTDGDHMVDGMSGATLTGNGVTKMMKVDPARYEPFFKKIAMAPTKKPAAAKPVETAPPKVPEEVVPVAPGEELVPEGKDPPGTEMKDAVEKEATAPTTTTPPPTTPPTTPPAKPAPTKAAPAAPAPVEKAKPSPTTPKAPPKPAAKPAAAGGAK